MTTQPARGLVPEFTLGDRLRKAREHAGYEQGPFAALLGVSRGTVSNYERELGTRGPKPIVLDQWAAKTGVSLQWLTTGHDDGQNAKSAAPGGGTTLLPVGDRVLRACRDSNPKPSDP
ncbi:helix-turn-helix domain-containing protein [Nocardioides marmoraquaticus]